MPPILDNRPDPKLGLAAEMLLCQGTVRLELRGTSMLPSLWPGDLLTIESAAQCELVPGDIVLVLRDHRFFAHRLVERRLVQDGVSWITKGDAVAHDDPPVAASELLGRVVGVRRAQRSFVPSQRLSPLKSMLAWMLCHWDRLRGLVLRIHAARLRAGSPRIFDVARRIPGISPSSTAHP